MNRYGSYSALPQGFSYPDDYVQMVEIQAAAPEPWQFINADSEVGNLLWTLAQSDGKNLVPFASLETGDGDAACFDGSDRTGNPQITMLILDGSGRSYGFRNFSHWLEEAKKWN